jgi:signal-transduction protein with cAMP-binding, CBS, and nucleotidyltransferase domain
LLADANGVPCGVVSKTDLIVAYFHGVAPDTEAREIMTTPVYSISAEALLSTAIQQMLIRDVQRLFVYRKASDPVRINGL